MKDLHNSIEEVRTEGKKVSEKNDSDKIVSDISKTVVKVVKKTRKKNLVLYYLIADNKDIFAAAIPGALPHQGNCFIQQAECFEFSGQIDKDNWDG